MGENYVLRKHEYFKQHEGIDRTSRAPGTGHGTPLLFRTPVGGEIERINDSSNLVKVHLPDGSTLGFRHASALFKETGAIVQPGEWLGITGSVGAAGVHLHYQAWDAAGRPMNPDVLIMRWK